MKAIIKKIIESNLFKIATSTHSLFIIISLIFGFCFIRIIPPLWGIDEITHFARVYQIDEGHLKAQKLPGGGTYGGQLPESLVRLNQKVHLNLDEISKSAFQSPHEVDSAINYRGLTATHFSGNTLLWDFTGAAAYSPLGYTGSAIGLAVAKVLHASIGHSIFIARVFGLFFYVILIATALYLLRKSQARWIVFIIGLLPMSIFQASIVNTDSIIIAESLLLFALYVRIWRYERGLVGKKLLSLTLILLCVLPLSKPTYIIFALPLLLVPNDKISKLKRAAIVYKVGVLLASLVITATWSYVVKDVARAVSSYRGQDIASKINVAHQTHFMLTHPLDVITAFGHTILLQGNHWLQGLFGSLGWNTVSIPLIAVIILAMLMVTAIFYDDEERTGTFWQGTLFTGTALMTALSVLVIFYVTYSVVGARLVEGVQGRYFVPVLPFFLYGLQKVSRAKLSMSEKTATLYFSGGTIFCLVISLLSYEAVL